MYDLIGDIHGHADALQQLLGELGYSRQKGVYRHPDRRVIFLGDFIDRGPKIRETLEIVRPMVESGTALSVMGNHELNALAFHTADPTKRGEHLRPHNEKNSHGPNQHGPTCHPSLPDRTDILGPSAVDGPIPAGAKATRKSLVLGGLEPGRSTYDRRARSSTGSVPTHRPAKRLGELHAILDVLTGHES